MSEGDRRAIIADLRSLRPLAWTVKASRAQVAARALSVNVLHCAAHASSQSCAGQSLLTSMPLALQHRAALVSPRRSSMDRTAAS